MILRNLRDEPPGGWRYKQEETGLQMMERNLPDLCRKIADHRRYKDLKRTLDLDAIALEVQRQICAGMNDSPTFCRPEIGFVNQPSVESVAEFEFQESEPVKVPAAFVPKPKEDVVDPSTEKKTARKRYGKRADTKETD